MKIIRKTTKIIPLLAIGYLVLISIVPLGACSNSVYETRVIPAGYYLAYPFTMEENDKLDVSFDVTLGGNLDIDLWVVDSTNFLRFKDLDSFYYKFKLERYVSYDFQFKAITSDTYYVIFSNSFSLITSKTVDIDIEYKPAPIFKFGPLWIILFGAGVIVIAAIAQKKYNSKTKKTNGNVVKNINEEPNKAIKIPEKQFCSDCGAQLVEKNSKYCPYCGKFQ